MCCPSYAITIKYIIYNKTMPWPLYLRKQVNTSQDIKTLVPLTSSNNYAHIYQSYMYLNVILVLYTPIDTSRGNM